MTSPASAILPSNRLRNALALAWAIGTAAVVIGILPCPAAAESEGPAVVRGPYLQSATTDSVTVRWRTDERAASVVRFGKAPDRLDREVAEAGLTNEHVVRLTRLEPATRYYYSVGTGAGALSEGRDHYFDTHPPIGSKEPARLWVIGDSGTADAKAAAVRDAWIRFNEGTHADVWLMLGDNAYNDGTDEQYQKAVFEMYPTILRNSVLWPTLGNHDGHSADSRKLTGPYYDMFTLPRQGEAGGTPSGTEAYYSFDYANVHFVCLESYETKRTSDGAMAEWLRQDLAATTQEWIVAYWHHPPYTKGSHDSDRERELVEMRQVFVPILEEFGVDLVLTGHSHCYERSKLVDGHYGKSPTFAESMVRNGGDGDPGGDGAYVKRSAPNQGAVYAVAGSSGKIGGGPLNHPIMVTSLNELGSVVIDVDDRVMDVRFIDDKGTVRDRFRIEHEAQADLPAGG